MRCGWEIDPDRSSGRHLNRHGHRHQRNDYQSAVRDPEDRCPGHEHRNDAVFHVGISYLPE